MAAYLRTILIFFKQIHFKISRISLTILTKLSKKGLLSVLSVIISDYRINFIIYDLWSALKSYICEFFIEKKDLFFLTDKVYLKLIIADLL